MVALVLIGLVFLFVFWILVVPIRLDVNSDTVRCRISQPGTIFCSVSIDEKVKIDARIFGINLPLDRWANRKRTPKKKIAKKKDSPGNESSKSLGAYAFLIKKLKKSFLIRDLTIDVDTDDVVANAELIPVFVLLSGEHSHFRTNNLGLVYLHLDIRCRLINILIAFIQFMFKK